MPTLDLQLRFARESMGVDDRLVVEAHYRTGWIKTPTQRYGTSIRRRRGSSPRPFLEDEEPHGQGLTDVKARNDDEWHTLDDLVDLPL